MVVSRQMSWYSVKHSFLHICTLVGTAGRTGSATAINQKRYLSGSCYTPHVSQILHAGVSVSKEDTDWPSVAQPGSDMASLLPFSIGQSIDHPNSRDRDIEPPPLHGRKAKESTTMV
jgi:hypothetical protein